MTKYLEYWAVLLDETGCEFGAGVKARSYEEAREKLQENYPESRVVQLETPADRADREQRMYDRLWGELDEDWDYRDDYDY